MGREEENNLIERHLSLVERIAFKHFPSRVHDDDLLQSGMIGLWEAAKVWDGSGDFEPLARLCIYHNMLDYLRAGPKSSTEELDDSVIDNRNWGDDVVELLLCIARVWPRESKEYKILSALTCGESKQEIAKRMGMETRQVTRIAKRAVKRVL